MSLIDLIGFIVSFVVFVVLMFKRARGGKPAEEHDARHDQDQDTRLRDFLKSLDVDMEEDEKPKPVQREVRRAPPPPPKTLPIPPRPPQKPVGALKTSLDKHSLVTTLDKRLPAESDPYAEKLVAFKEVSKEDAYALNKKFKPPRAAALLAALKSKQDMVILNEILSKPKALS